MIELKHALSGRFMLQTAKADAEGNEIPGTRKVVAPWQDNLITDNGMDYIGGNGASPNTFLGYVSVGSGANPPQFTDSALQARVATTSTSNNNENGFAVSAPYFTWYRRQFQFGTGAAAGVLSEIGITGYNGTPAYTRALIKDSAGNPTTITVLPDELLIVTYERRVYCHTEDVVTTATIKGVETTITIRPSQLGTSSGHNAQGTPYWTDYIWGGYWYHGGTGVGPITGVPTGTQVSYSNAEYSNAAYTSGTYYRDQIINLTVQNAAGLTLTAFEGLYAATSYQIGFQPGVPKTNAETVALRLRMSWARYEP
ncbi:hypothetical protein IVIADoCa9_46 [Xanthomonas phage vB_Xar_IVIA-DoCa9]|uniref:Uncharacterized protein n=1 Tax=Xanthomonas phage vB_Xar_IVIA-DoCa9 TaxID=2975536 RepID=A0A9X9JNB6_9CAUD|nr:hypothetical protein IVIADoCa9_46 [Xanthomonas phage vB_Xar_IVIA-DoCa9]